MERITVKQFENGTWSAGALHADLDVVEATCLDAASRAVDQCIEQGVFTDEANRQTRQYDLEIIRLEDQ